VSTRWSSSARALGPDENEQRKGRAEQRHDAFLAAATEKGRNPALYTADWQARIGLTETQFGLLAGELAYQFGFSRRDVSYESPRPDAPDWKLQRNSAFQSTDSLLLFWLRCLQAKAVAKPAKQPTQLQVAQECGLALTQGQANQWATRMDTWGRWLLTLFLTAGSAQEFKAAMKVARFSPELAYLTKYQEEECYDRNAAEDRAYRREDFPLASCWEEPSCK
jgi:hypothetical protein